MSHPFYPRLRFRTHPWQGWWQSRLLILQHGNLRATCPIDWDSEHQRRRSWYLAERQGLDWWSAPRAGKAVSLRAAKRWLLDSRNHERVKKLNEDLLKRLRAKVETGSGDDHTKDFLRRLEAEHGS